MEKDIPWDKAGLGSSELMAQPSWGNTLRSSECKLLLLSVHTSTTPKASL